MEPNMCAPKLYAPKLCAPKLSQKCLMRIVCSHKLRATQTACPQTV